MKRVPLAKNKGIALVDDDDFDKIAPIFWALHSDGYAVGSGGRILMHRLIMDAPRGLEVDHINHNRLDNRRINLRLVDKHQQQMNLPRKAVGFRGVGVFKRTGQWQAYISVNGRRQHLGLFATPEEAAHVRDAAAFAAYGEIAQLNFAGGSHDMAVEHSRQ